MDNIGANGVFLTRNYLLDNNNSVTIRIWKPIQMSDGSNKYCCQYQVLGIGSEKIRNGYGMDEVHAINSSLILIGAFLYESEEYIQERLTYYGSKDLDLPMLPSERSGGMYENANLLTSVGEPTVLLMPDVPVAHMSFSLEWFERLLARLVAIDQGQRSAIKELASITSMLSNHLAYAQEIWKRSKSA